MYNMKRVGCIFIIILFLISFVFALEVGDKYGFENKGDLDVNNVLPIKDEEGILLTVFDDGGYINIKGKEFRNLKKGSTIFIKNQKVVSGAIVPSEKGTYPIGESKLEIGGGFIFSLDKKIVKIDGGEAALREITLLSNYNVDFPS